MTALESFPARLGNGRAIHLANDHGVYCGANLPLNEGPKRTTDTVTCKNCIKTAKAVDGGRSFAPMSREGNA